MVKYQFECDPCEIYVEEEKPLGQASVNVSCPKCGEKMDRVYGANIFVFKPYTDYHVDKKPVEFSSRRERDVYLKNNGLTYDTGKYVRRSYKPASDTLTVDEVMGALKNADPRETKKELYRGPIGDSSEFGSA